MNQKKQKKNNNSSKKGKIGAFVNKAKDHPVIIILSALFTIITITASITAILTYAKNNSSLSIDYISSESNIDKNAENIRFGIHNYSEDAKEITSLKICIVDYRDDKTNNFILYCQDVEQGIALKIYNSGWCDLFNVSFSIAQDSAFYHNLKNKKQFDSTVSVLKHGEIYDLGELSVDDLYDKTNNSPVEIVCKESNDNKIYKASCVYQYNSYSDKLVNPGKGGPTEIYNLCYCIDSKLGVHTYEYPVTYTCPANGYEELKLSLSADRSCHLRYSIEFYANGKMIKKTEEKGTHIQIDSRFGPPIKNSE